MKIFYVNATCGMGSTGNIVEEFATEYINRGHECKIFYGNGNSSNPHAVKMTGLASVKVHALLSRFTGLQGYYSNCATNRLIKAVKTEKPDIVHLHNLHGNFINSFKFLKYLKENDIPTVITLHDCNAFTGKCTHYTSAGCYRWQSGCGNCPRLKSDIPSYFFDRTGKMLKDKERLYQEFKRLGVIAVSEWIKTQAEKSILKTANIKRVYNWVDTSVFTPNNSKNESFIVLGVSAKWKGGSSKYLDFVELAKSLPDTKFVLVGKREGNIKFPPNVVFIDYVSSALDMAKLYQSSGVYVHLSREDSYGKVITEALACGTPVIVYDATACPELVDKGCGYVVGVGDLSAVKEKILEVKNTGKDFYFENCVKSANKFEKGNIFDQTLEFYGDIIKGK
ncbi:MAG: glycosyltransferase [Clostridia bacterium]|nr:glycosyltransferase [Clostridia bacterium]